MNRAGETTRRAGHVVLVIPPDRRKSFFGKQPPIGTLTAASRLRRGGCEVSFLDLRVEEEDLSAVGGGRPPAANLAADLVIVATNDFDKAQCFNLNLENVRCVIEGLRERTDAPVYCVGSHGTVAPEETLEAVGADGVLRGEHDVVVPDFVNVCASGAALPQVWPANPRLATARELADLPLPAYDLARMDRYFAAGFSRQSGELGVYNSGLLLGNRGCPYTCSFCYLFFGSRIRTRPVAPVADELEEQYRSHGIGHFFFLDYTFTLKPRWVRELCDEIVRRRLPVSWLCQTRCDCLDSETLHSMREAGCAGIWVGVESPSHSSRASVAKPMDDSHISRSVELIRDHGMHCLAFLILGFADETVESLERINRWVEEHDVYYEIFNLIPRVGTELFERGRWNRLFATAGWDYGRDAGDQRVGARSAANEAPALARIPASKLDAFLAYHARHPRRVANVVDSILKTDPRF